MACCFDDFTCLVDGKEAFPEILACIAGAQKSIYINMFIWRDDDIGNALARAILDAAERGVRVHLSIDRVGAVLEGAEEYRSSFFHRSLTLPERMKICCLRLFYPDVWTKKRAVDADGSLYRALMAHPNITAETTVPKADHSKYYIFDDEVLILGGINVEDKENGRDISGRVYQDHMVKMHGKGYVEALGRALRTGSFSAGNYGFCVNTKESSPPVFSFEAHYLSLIREAREELLIIMPYFAPPKVFLDAITEAHRRGVEVTLLLPERSNLNKDSTLRAAKRLMDATDNGIRLFLSPRMLHTKLIANEQTISMGSANMMKNTFTTLSELNLFFTRSPHPFCQRMWDSVADTLAAARPVRRGDQLRFSALKAWVEELVVG